VGGRRTAVVSGSAQQAPAHRRSAGCAEPAGRWNRKEQCPALAFDQTVTSSSRPGIFWISSMTTRRRGASTQPLRASGPGRCVKRISASVSRRSIQYASGYDARSRVLYPSVAAPRGRTSCADSSQAKASRNHWFRSHEYRRLCYRPLGCARATATFSPEALTARSACHAAAAAGRPPRPPAEVSAVPSLAPYTPGNRSQISVARQNVCCADHIPTAG